MRNLLFKSVAILVAVVLPGLATVNWKPLFNGTSFTGWNIAGATSYWRVDPADSAIVGESSTQVTPYTMVFTDRTDFDQFTIKYSYRLLAGCSGFFFRSKKTATTELVEGIQVEAKFAAGNQSEVGSLYIHPSPGWVVQHPESYSDRVARAGSVYQDVIVTVKRPNIYVNVNGYQAVGETDLAELNLGAKAAFNYTSSPASVTTPGNLGLQIHGGQLPMNVRFKRIQILEGCGDPASPRYDGAFVAGLPKQPAVYQDNGTCIGTPVNPGKPGEPDASRFLGMAQRAGSSLVVPVFAAHHNFELFALDGQILFSASHPAAKDYHIPVPARPGIYVAKVKTQGAAVARKFVVP